MNLEQIATVFIVLFIISGCATVPEPLNETDSLVVGNFTMDFVDGFFNLAPRLVENNIWVRIRDLETGKEFDAKTNQGFFHFLGQAEHEYALLYIKSDLERAGVIYTFGANIGYEFSVPAQSVAYIGHWRMVYMAPDKEQEKERESSWNFEKDLQLRDMQSSVRPYIDQIAPDSVWNSYRIEAVGFDQ